MGIDIQLQDEDGKILEHVSDEKRLLHDLLPGGDHSLLSGIDLYGDTIFNRIQMDDFLSEWSKLKMKQMSSAQALHLDRIECLALKCKESVHLYLKFVGD
jgi:hypothetical protein